MNSFPHHDAPSWLWCVFSFSLSSSSGTVKPCDSLPTATSVLNNHSNTADFILVFPRKVLL